MSLVVVFVHQRLWAACIHLLDSELIVNRHTPCSSVLNLFYLYICQTHFRHKLYSWSIYGFPRNQTHELCVETQFVEFHEHCNVTSVCGCAYVWDKGTCIFWLHPKVASTVIFFFLDASVCEYVCVDALSKHSAISKAWAELCHRMLFDSYCCFKRTF